MAEEASDLKSATEQLDSQFTTVVFAIHGMLYNAAPLSVSTVFVGVISCSWCGRQN